MSRAWLLSTVKPLIMDPPKNRLKLCTVDRSLCPNCLHHSTNTLSASEKRTPLNFVQRTLPSPKHSLTIQNYLQEWTVKLHPTINRMLVDHFHKIECHCGWIQRPGITLRSSVACRANLSHYQRGPKMCLIMLNSPST